MRASSLLGLSMLTVSLAVVAARAPVPQSSLGLFQGETDVGQVTKRGSVTYDAGQDQYTIAGSGANMWLDHDDFHFVWKRIQGNFILAARARFNAPMYRSRASRCCRSWLRSPIPGSYSRSNRGGADPS